MKSLKDSMKKPIMKRQFPLLLILLLLISFASAEAQEYQYITSLTVTGNINVSPDLIKSASQLALGDIYIPERVSEAIRNIYQLDLFEDVRINKIDTEKGVELIIKVVEKPIIEEFLITGNKKVKTAAIIDSTRLVEGDYWSESRAFEVKKKILALYHQEGYLLASVDIKTQKVAPNNVILTILIDEGERLIVNDVQFTGNHQVAEDKLRGVMKTKTKSFFRSGVFKMDQFEEDLTRIEEFYHSEGFIDANVTGWDYDYDEKGNLILQIDVYEGNKYKVGKVSVEGNTRFDDETILSLIEIKPGEIFNQQEFEEQLHDIRSLYYEEGYIYSVVQPEIKQVKDSVNAVIQISENNRAKIRKIFIQGNTQTKEKIVRRQLEVVPGDYFRQSLIIQSQRNIYNLGFFTPNIGLSYQPINDDGDVDITFEVEEKVAGTVTAGIGYDQLDKFTGFLGLSHSNLFGNAWRVSLKWEFSSVTQDYDISFTNPYLADRNLLLGVDAYHTRRDWTDWNYRIQEAGGGIRAGTLIPWVDYSRITVGYSITQKEYNILDANDYVSEELQQLADEGKKLTSEVSLTLERDGRDNVFRPTQGSLIRSSTQLAGGPFRGDINFYKEILQTNWYLPLFWETALGWKWRVGYISAYGDSKSVPPEERFYPGGIGLDGIRGYSERSVPGYEGGNAELILSTELTIPIAGDQLFGVLFFDAGNAYKHFSDINVHGLKRGAGIGIRIMTPFGPLGFDYAYGFDKETEDKWEFHFQLGTIF